MKLPNLKDIDPRFKRQRPHYLRLRKRIVVWRPVEALGVGLLFVIAIVVVLRVAGNVGMGADGASRGAAAAVNPFNGQQLYVDPNSNAARQAAVWQASDPAKADAMYKLADQESAKWFTGPVTYDDVHDYVQTANDAGKLPVTVAYFIPDRDCNQYSSGGAKDAAAYYDYIDTYASAIGNLNAVVVLEPDAVAHLLTEDGSGKPCMSKAQAETYTTLLSYAVDRFKSLSSTIVYIDAGNSGWSMDAGAIAAALRRSGVEEADGFSLNVANFRTNDETIALGKSISDRLQGKHYIIDTSRNGLGPYVNTVHPQYNWCNPPGRAIGHYPTTQTNVPSVDAFLFIKNVGESDGSDPDPNKCFGGPPAGEWWPDYALGLVQRWPPELQRGKQ